MRRRGPRTNPIAIILVVVLAVAGFACVRATLDTSLPKDKGWVNGTVTYNQRIALSPEARIVVTLQDCSVADAPANILAEQTITGRHTPPIPFALAFDPAKIDERNTYIVTARIFEQDRLLFDTTRSYPVLTRRSPLNPEVRVEMVGPK